MSSGNVHDPQFREAKPSQGNPAAPVANLFRLDGRTIVGTFHRSHLSLRVKMDAL